MQRTIGIRFEASEEEKVQLLSLQEAYFDACNAIVPDVILWREKTQCFSAGKNRASFNASYLLSSPIL